MTIYKIRNKQGLFSTAGTNPQFVTEGKYFASIKALKIHISRLKERKTTPYPYEGCEIVAYYIARSVPIEKWKGLK